LFELFLQEAAVLSGKGGGVEGRGKGVLSGIPLNSSLSPPRLFVLTAA
jgi:hypothetical protein